MLSFLQGCEQYKGQFEELMIAVQQAVCLKALILVAFKFGLGVAIVVVE